MLNQVYTPEYQLPDLLRALPAEDDGWLDAELYYVYDYARCSKRLSLPTELKTVLPVRLQST